MRNLNVTITLINLNIGSSTNVVVNKLALTRRMMTFELVKAIYTGTV
jgi:hypothetical protein